MPRPPKAQTQIQLLVKEVKACKAFVLKSLSKITSAAPDVDDDSFKKQIEDKSKRIQEMFKNLEQKTYSLEDFVASNNYLLEYKRKDLLVQTDSLQDALDEISVRNKELNIQKLQISEQAEKLRQSHEEILEKNHQLEQQTESLLDQTDYLHEANQTITRMHQEVQRQKTEIEEKSKELLSLNQEKNNLIGIVAHDLKSPLNQIKGLTAIVKMTATSLDAENLHYIDLIDKSATRLNEMINKILDVEAIESKKINLKIESVNLSNVLADLADRYQLTAQQKQVEIVCSLEQNILVEADKGYVEQIMENIVSNALKFSPTHRKVYLKLYHENGNAITEIKDEGPGLNEDDKKKLFGKYQKLSAKPTGNETSTGLGLSIVKKFVDAMKGEIWCYSEKGNGASFFVSFVSKQNVI